MKVKCGYCGTIFDYEENKKVCPNCKKFSTLPEQKKTEEIKIKPEIKEEESNIEKKSDETVDLSEITEKRKGKKNFYILITLFLAIVILPLSMGLFSDSSEKINGPDGTIISTELKKITLNSALNDLFYIEKIGYTNNGKLYIMYESNIHGFAECGYEINFSVKDIEGNIIPLGCTSSDFTVLRGENNDSYLTKAIFDYTNDENRITNLIINIKNLLNSQTIATYSMDF